ncbi:MAG TPA: DUF1697 domain-containing protein [Patescibacteria group bacterium]|nr:DUF1697 domain-containing protein [Patescibacteria group bacterium]
MSKFVAMIRGVGPGNPNMTSEKFKVFFTELGFTNVSTVLASGNVIFESQDNNTSNLANLIEQSMPKKLGYSRSVIVRSQSELQKIIGLDIFKGVEQSHNKGTYLLITFFRNRPTLNLKLPFIPENKPYKIIGKADKVIFGVIDLTKSKTPDYMLWLEKMFGKDITSRTPKTIRLILSRMSKP